MSKKGRAIGGYVRRCERVTADNSTVGHLVPNCPFCGVPYTNVHAGTAWHDMSRHPELPIWTSMLRFEPFDVPAEKTPPPLQPEPLTPWASTL